MSQRFSFGAGRATRDEVALGGRPFYLILYLVMIAGYVTALVSVEPLREPVRLVPFTAMLLVHGGLYWLSERQAAFRQGQPLLEILGGRVAIGVPQRSISPWQVRWRARCGPGCVQLP